MNPLIPLLTVSVCATAFAQEPPQARIRTLCFQTNADSPKKLAVLQEDKVPVEINLSSSFPTRTAAVPVSGNKIVFHVPGEPETPAAVATLPAGTRNVLILFAPAPEAKAPLKFESLVMDLSQKGLPEDGAIVLNACKQPVRVVVGEHRVQIESGARRTFARPSLRNDFNMAPVVVLYEQDEEWETAAETLVGFPPGLRHLFVAYENPRNQRVTMRPYKLKDL